MCTTCAPGYHGVLSLLPKPFSQTHPYLGSDGVFVEGINYIIRALNNVFGRNNFLSAGPTCYLNTPTRKYSTTTELNIAKLTTAIGLFSLHNLGEKWMQE